MITKEVLETMQEIVNDVTRNILSAVRELTAENPLILYDKEKLDGSDDKFYELPFAYYVDKHFFYCEGRIVQVQGDNVLMLFTGEEFGEEHELELNEIPYESLVELLSYLKERM